jgi:hypothetical protein
VSPEQEVATRKSEMMPGAGVHPEDSAKVARLIASGDTSAAVEAAKKIHKRVKNAASEALLVDAYIARIPALIERKLEVEARNLMEHVRDRYPASRERLKEIKPLFSVRKGELDALLQPLNDPSLSEEKRAAIYKTIAYQVGDLGVLAQCQALPAEHPLRKTATALTAALEAVTSGPVDDQALILPEISRHSPFAPWKMLLRAIAAFYRKDDELCEKCLAAVDPHSASARLIPALRTMIGQKQTLTPASVFLVRQAGGSVETLLPKLQRLDQLLGGRNQSQAIREMRDVIRECHENCPEIFERLKQHISVQALQAGLKRQKVESALQGHIVLRDAYFWRLLARMSEDSRLHPGALFVACSAWEEFRRHALREAWFPANGPEVATLYLHMADLLNRLPLDEHEPIRRQFILSFDGHAHYYQNQPAEIRAVMLPRGKIDLYFIYSEKLLEKACEADPCAENFQRWFDWTARHNPFRGESVALRWRGAFPKDVRPLLHLMELAEKTNALQRAFGFMEQAEQLDGLNPQVRKARLRLLVSIAVRHLKNKKARLSELDLEAIERLPQIQQGDRKAFVAALRWVSSMLWGSQEERETRSANVARLLNSEVAAQVVLTGVAGACKLQVNAIAPSALAPDARAAAGIGRACALGDDMGFEFEIPRALSGRLLQELSSSDLPPDLPGLVAIGEAALRADNSMLAYAVAGAGLAGNPASHASFLFLRARSLPPWEMQRHDGCLSAASELARRQRDHGLLDRIGQWREQMLDDMVQFDDEVAMSTEQINRVIQRENGQRAYPTSQPKYYDDGDEDDDVCDCPDCRKRRAGMPPGMPPGLEVLEDMLEEMAERFGQDEVEAAIDDLFGGLKRKRKKKQRHAREVSDHDIPF